MTQTDVQPNTDILLAIADTIKDLGSVPSGRLYAVLMGRMSLDTYTTYVQYLEYLGLVKVSRGHLITWLGAKETSKDLQVKA